MTDPSTLVGRQRPAPGVEFGRRELDGVHDVLRTALTKRRPPVSEPGETIPSTATEAGAEA